MLGFVIETQPVSCEVGTESLCAVMNSKLQRARQGSKIKQGILGRTNRLISLIRLGPHRKRRKISGYTETQENKVI
jgi:hypothetical protein